MPQARRTACQPQVHPKPGQELHDFAHIKAHFTVDYPPADFNHDGIVDIDDFGLLKLNFGEYGDVLVTHHSILSPEG